jgi:hypothetical protein
VDGVKPPYSMSAGVSTKTEKKALAINLIRTPFLPPGSNSPQNKMESFGEALGRDNGPGCATPIILLGSPRSEVR